jgi:hypothetical protein
LPHFSDEQLLAILAGDDAEVPMIDVTPEPSAE